MLDLTELNWALEHNRLAIQNYNGNLAGYTDLLVQRNNIQSMIIQVMAELNQSKKVA